MSEILNLVAQKHLEELFLHFPSAAVWIYSVVVLFCRVAFIQHCFSSNFTF